VDLPHVDADRGLVDAAAAGDRDAFDELVLRHHPAVIGLVRALTGGREDAEDLAQETFVRAWKSLRSFRGESSFRTWLHRVAINVIRTFHAREARMRRFVLPRREAPQEPASSAPPIDTDLARRQIVERSLAALPEDLRVAVTLRDLQGLEYREIAEMLALPIGTVESRIFRARQRLRPLLAPLVTGDF
jgi:RNA polymerase sigma-70 factor, ECF subfamily